MQTIHLQIEDDYIEEFFDVISKDKVIIIEKDFDENKILLANELEKYQNNKDSFIVYSESLTNIDNYLKEIE